MTTFAADSADAVIPLALDVVWLLAALVWLLIPVAIAVAERRRAAPWPETFLWFMVAFCLPRCGADHLGLLPGRRGEAGDLAVSIAIPAALREYGSVLTGARSPGGGLSA